MVWSTLRVGSKKAVATDPSALGLAAFMNKPGKRSSLTLTTLGLEWEEVEQARFGRQQNFPCFPTRARQRSDGSLIRMICLPNVIGRANRSRSPVFVALPASTPRDMAGLVFLTTGVENKEERAARLKVSSASIGVGVVELLGLVPVESVAFASTPPPKSAAALAPKACNVLVSIAGAEGANGEVFLLLLLLMELMVRYKKAQFECP